MNQTISRDVDLQIALSSKGVTERCDECVGNVPAEPSLLSGLRSFEWIG